MLFCYLLRTGPAGVGGRISCSRNRRRPSLPVSGKEGLLLLLFGF